MALRKPCPPGQCRQCWECAYDPDIHRNLAPGQQCPRCTGEHMHGNHGSQIVPKKESIWW